MRLTCIYCGWYGTSQSFEIDHIVPLSRGGSSSLSNLRWICSGCNRQKGKMSHEEYLTWRLVNFYTANHGPKVG